MTTVLFICNHNAGRSQLGAHLFAAIAPEGVVTTSGGLSPAQAINPAIAATLAELDIDASGAVPRAVTAEDLATADIVVTMKPGLALPGPVAGELVEWSFPDPANWEADGARGLRDDVFDSVKALAARL
ncbi:hypothetical protein GCM10009808_15380 [Microbacterium sediminicola]|uniref:Phosphotyrosine protein phosphatase I domain-containing protein n=1 Tax=Microbacterium sediminicola TaxID=415210 RepID=A0ABP4U7Q8_9MICO